MDLMEFSKVNPETQGLEEIYECANIGFTFFVGGL